MVNHPAWHAEGKALPACKFARNRPGKTCVLSHFFAIIPGIQRKTSVKRATILNDLRIYR
jgi:hypothetical protein